MLYFRSRRRPGRAMDIAWMSQSLRRVCRHVSVLLLACTWCFAVFICLRSTLVSPARPHSGSMALHGPAWPVARPMAAHGGQGGPRRTKAQAKRLNRRLLSLLILLYDVLTRSSRIPNGEGSGRALQGSGGAGQGRAGQCRAAAATKGRGSGRQGTCDLAQS